MLFFYTAKEFMQAVANGKPDKVKKYMAHSKRAEWLALRNENGETPLHIAAREQYPNTFAALVAGGPAPDEIDRSGRTALNLALEGSDTDRRDTIVRALLGIDANPNLAPTPDEAPLRRALEKRGTPALHAEFPTDGDRPVSLGRHPPARRDGAFL